MDVRYRETDDSTGNTGQGWLRFVVSLKASSGNEVSSGNDDRKEIPENPSPEKISPEKLSPEKTNP